MTGVLVGGGGGVSWCIRGVNCGNISVLTHFESSENRTRRALRAEKGVHIEMRVNLLGG